jgi:hypothetical protein
MAFGAKKFVDLDIGMSNNNNNNNNNNKCMVSGLGNKMAEYKSPSLFPVITQIYRSIKCKLYR